MPGKGKPSQAGWSQKYQKVDLNDPEHYQRMVQNIVNLHRASPASAIQSGSIWYPSVHDAVTKGIKGTSMSHLHGSGVVAAVSPAMDWEGRNIHAFTELNRMRGHHWAAIHASANDQARKHAENASVRNHNNEMIKAGRADLMKALPHNDIGRSSEAARVLSGTTLTGATDANLVRAHRIMEGEHPDVVLNRETSPKTNSFTWNIHQPHQPLGPVTIDYRAHDVAMNQLQPAGYSNRGISAANLKSGKKSRYEHMEDGFRDAGHIVGVDSGSQMQAETWESAKHWETSVPTKSGGQRVKGVARRGQGYSDLYLPSSV